MNGLFGNKTPSEGKTPEKQEEKAPEKHTKGLSGGKNEASHEEKAAELTDLLQRTRADFENYQKRMDKEKQAIRLLGEAETLRQLLPVRDSFEQALEKGSETEKKALEPIARQFFKTLEGMGLRPIETIGKKFDPHTQDCLLTEWDAEKAEDIVLEELQKGFFFQGMVLRHAKVKVNQRPETIEADKNEDG